MASIGLERTAKTPEKQGVSAKRGTESGAVGGDPSAHHQTTGLNTQTPPPDLAEVARVWPNLPPAIRAGIMAIVRTANQ